MRYGSLLIIVSVNERGIRVLNECQIRIKLAEVVQKLNMCKSINMSKSKYDYLTGYRNALSLVLEEE
jgi:hypothetical protein